MVAEDLLFSNMSYELLQASATGDGLPLRQLSLSAASIACRLAQLQLVTQEDGHLVATTRGRVVCLAETEQSAGGAGVRVRAGALWTTELSKRWAALNGAGRSPWGS